MLTDNTAGSIADNLYVALIHYPVMNKRGQTAGSAITTIDLHDIARASRTFGVRGFYVVTPYEDQAELAEQVMGHWTRGVGSTLNPDRKQALELVRITPGFDDMLEEIEKENRVPAMVVATSAKTTAGTVSIEQLKKQAENEVPHVLVFGTAWGLADPIIDRCTHILDPIEGNTGYNHLSVRSAASIYLDRMINDRQ